MEKENVVQEFEHDDNCFWGYLGAFVGGIVGTIPLLLLYYYTSFYLPIISFFIPIGGVFGYKYLKGIVVEKTSKSIFAISLLVMALTFLVLLPYCYSLRNDITLEEFYEDRHMSYLYEEDSCGTIEIIALVIGMCVATSNLNKTLARYKATNNMIKDTNTFIRKDNRPIEGTDFSNGGISFTDKNENPINISGESFHEKVEVKNYNSNPSSNSNDVWNKTNSYEKKTNSLSDRPYINSLLNNKNKVNYNSQFEAKTSPVAFSIIFFVVLVTIMIISSSQNSNDNNYTDYYYNNNYDDYSYDYDYDNYNDNNNYNDYDDYNYNYDDYSYEDSYEEEYQWNDPTWAYNSYICDLGNSSIRITIPTVWELLEKNIDGKSVEMRFAKDYEERFVYIIEANEARSINEIHNAFVDATFDENVKVSDAYFSANENIVYLSRDDQSYGNVVCTMEYNDNWIVIIDKMKNNYNNYDISEYVEIFSSVEEL